MLWILVVVIAVVLLYIFRNFVRWIIFFPISYGIALLVNIFKPIQLLIQSFISSKSYSVGIVLNSLSIVVDLLIIVLISSLIAPISKIGKIISCIFCFLIGLYSLCVYHCFSVIPIGMDKNIELDLLSNAIYILVFLISSYVLISSSSDGSFEYM